MNAEKKHSSHTINIPMYLMQPLKIYKAKYNYHNLQDAINSILDSFLLSGKKADVQLEGGVK